MHGRSAAGGRCTSSSASRSGACRDAARRSPTCNGKLRVQGGVGAAQAGYGTHLNTCWLAVPGANPSRTPAAHLKACCRVSRRGYAEVIHLPPVHACIPSMSARNHAWTALYCMVGELAGARHRQRPVQHDSPSRAGASTSCMTLSPVTCYARGQRFVCLPLCDSG
jgi:hypothetical protein